MTLCLSIHVQAQRHVVYSDDIATLQVVVNDDWLQPPVMQLGSSDVINISFDELSHTYHRYTYHITHCDANWNPSKGLFLSDYLAGFNGETIDDCEESINTNQLYTHYSLQIPNERCRLKMSGNYRLSVIDDETEDTVLTACFYVVEPKVMPRITVLDNTDIDIRKSHQQLEVRIDYGKLPQATDPRRQFTVKAMQNERVDNMVTLPPAPQLMNGAMQWTHCRPLIFDAGNEYHKFEFLDAHRNSLGVESVEWDPDDERFHAHIFHDYERRSYTSEHDANGAFYVRNSDNIENNTTTDYSITHFYLDTPKLPGDVYIEGKWTLNTLSDKYRMEYLPTMKCYHLALPLKMGYYSYQYLFVPSYSTLSRPVTCPTEGNFYETNNDYAIFVYFRGDIDRTDRLVGYLSYAKR